MSDLDSRFRDADRIHVSDQWQEIVERAPRPKRDEPGPVRRLVIVAFALALALGGVAFAVRALRPDGRTSSTTPSPTEEPSPVPALTGEPRITAEIPIPRGHFGSVGAVGAGSVWVGISPTNGDGPRDVLMRIDLATNEVIAEIPIRSFPGPIAATDEAIWVASSAAIERIDPASNTVVAVVEFPGRHISALAADGSAVWAVTIQAWGGPANEGILVRIDPMTNAVVAEIPLGAQVVGYADQVRIGAGAVWVLGVRWIESEDAEYGSDLIRVDPATNTVVARIPVGGFGMVMSTNDVWVRFPADGIFDFVYAGERGEAWLWTRVNMETKEASEPFEFVDSGLQLVTPQALWSVGSAEYDEQENVRVTRFDPATLEVVARSEPIAPVFTGAVIDPASGTVWVSTVSSIVRLDIT